MPLFRSGLILFICFVSLSLQAQESVIQETNAPGIKWQQLNAPHFRLLFPVGYETQAQRVANTLEAIREPEAKSMGMAPKKITIVLQNQSALSNGFVTVAPRRAEFYTMPAQNYNFAGTNDWLNLLASHEYRHMVQFERSKTGFTKLVSWVFGQQAYAGLAFAAAPQWFWEGDAVATETAFTPSGRGRIPNFDLVFRTNILEGRTFNYSKQYLRSYKHNIPNHYVLGYNMISYLRKKTGDPMIWDKVTHRAWGVPFIPFSFSNAIKNKTGMYVSALYREMAAERKKDYEQALAGIEFTPFETLSERNSTAYTDYLYPQPLENNRVLVTKSGIGDIETLVVLGPDGKEEDKYVQGPINDAGMLSATNQRVVWNEYRFDPRWLVHTYSVVKGYDFGSKQERIVSSHSRYAGAALSPDGYRVATVESTNDYVNRMVILDYFTGRVLTQLPNPGNDLLTMPRWTPDGKHLVVLRTSAAGRTISRINAETGASENLIPVGSENVGYPVIFDRFVLFNSPVSGIDNIYALDMQSGERFQVTSAKYGAYNPAVSTDGKTLYYNNQGKDGMDVVRTEFNPAAWKKFTAPAPSANNMYDHLVEQEGNPSVFSQVGQEQFPVACYHRAQGMINPHSWGPYFINSLTQAQVGIASNDILSTTAINAGYIYDINERNGAWKAKVSYQGFLPIIDFSYAQSSRSVNEGNYRFYRIDTLQKAPVKLDTITSQKNITFHWNEKTIETGLRLPLLTTTSKFVGSVTLGNMIGYSQISGFTNSVSNSRIVPAFERSGPKSPPTVSTKDGSYFFRDYADNGNLIYNHFSVVAYRVLKQSRRDINSKWGQGVFIDYFNTPYGGNFNGGQFSFYGLSYFPGLFKHHSIWGYWAYQHSVIKSGTLNQNGVKDNYIFRNQIPLPRGQSVSRAQNIYSMAVNYTLPLWYPDIAVGPLLNIQRVRANGFLDYAQGTNPDFVTATFNGKSNYLSTGVEVRFDFNVMRFLQQFNVGFRYSYGISPSVTQFEVLVGNINF